MLGEPIGCDMVDPMSGEVSTKPMQSPDDDEFDLAVYASTRLPELAVLGWAPQQADRFVRMQYRAQAQHYRLYYPDADWFIATVDGQAAGRLIVARSDHDLLIVDIALLPRYRGSGVGGNLVRRLIAQADEVGIPLRCHVELSNPARGFWEHFGMVPTRVDGAHILMERTCGTSPR